MSRSRLPRRLGATLLVLAVTVAHWWAAEQLPDSMLGQGASDDLPAAIEVAFVQVLAPAAPPVFSAPRPPAPARSPARPPRPAASTPESSASEPAQRAVLADAAASAIADERAASSAPPGPPASAAMAAASAPPSASGAASAPAAASATPADTAAVAFDWPPSTRLLYTFEGYSRGPVYGNAKVEWLRDGPHYQVRLEVRVPPLGGRRMISDGQLGPQGLVPRRYDEETDRLFHEVARQSVLLEPGRIVLANGRVNDPVPGVQDTASQFVQMTWLFLTHPERLRPGAVVEFPLALPRRLGRWTYDVREPEDLTFAFGTVRAYHLEPRPQSRRGNEWLVDIWIAPSLQYLPARITLRQDAENYGELRLKSLPVQEAAAPASEAPGGSRIVP